MYAIKNRNLLIWLLTVIVGIFTCLAIFWQAQIGHLLAASSDINVKVCHAPIAPVITSPSNGTTDQSTAVINGTAPNNAVVYVTRNGTETGFVTAASNGTYTVSTPLIEGNNTLQTSTRNDCSQSALSNSVNLVYTTSPITTPPPTSTPPQPSSQPASQASNLQNSGQTALQGGSTATPGSPIPSSALEPTSNPVTQTNSAIQIPTISAPSDGSTTKQSQILVEGRVQPFSVVKLFVNGKQVAQTVSRNGYFTMSAPLKPGINRIEITAIYESKEIKSQPIFVTYDDTKPSTATDYRIKLIIFIIMALTLIGAGLVIIKRRKKRKMSEQTDYNLYQ